MTDLTFFQFEVEEGDSIEKGETFGVIESVKATEDLYAATSGEIVAINEDISENLDTLTGDPYGDGWLIEIKAEDLSEIEDLMDRKAYEEHIKEEDH